LGQNAAGAVVSGFGDGDRRSVVPGARRRERARGKTEMWHILEAAPGATIAMGFREPITRERLWEATRTGEVEHLLPDAGEQAAIAAREASRFLRAWVPGQG
jgi:hypothetical protein